MVFHIPSCIFDIPAQHFFITGRVQGVFFRVETKRVADELGVKGWVRNCDDGSVEAVASGAEEQLKQFEEWCRRGPPAAHVDHVTVEPIAEEAFSTFEIRR